MNLGACHLIKVDVEGTEADVLLCEAFPVMSDFELEVLGEDIKANGLRAEALLAQCDRETGFNLPVEKAPCRELAGHSGSLPALLSSESPVSPGGEK